MHRSLAPVDHLAVGYLLLSGLCLVPQVGDGGVHAWVLAGHLGAAVAILGLRRVDGSRSPHRALRELYPILLLLVFYLEVDLLARAVHDPPGYDALVRSWDALLFGAHPHVVLAQHLDGRLWRELFHGLYVSYYLLLIGSFVGVWWTAPDQFARFAFVVTGMFVSFLLVFVAFPVAGPLTAPDVSIMTNGWFPQLVAWIYVPIQINGITTGAFPSSHVGMSVGIACLLAPRRWTWRCLLWGLVVGISVSTTYGRFHYAIDAVAGLAAGVLLYLLWTALYSVLQKRENGSAVRSARAVRSL
ncbi:MAG: phosphatase PAP2 family protein [Salinivenus sp.]